jgi:hypothetical protein
LEIFRVTGKKHVFSWKFAAKVHALVSGMATFEVFFGEKPAFAGLNSIRKQTTGAGRSQ